MITSNTSIARRALLIFLLLVASLLAYGYWDRCPCEDRVSYENVNINDGIDLDRLFRPVEADELLAAQKTARFYEVSYDQYRIVAQMDYQGSNRQVAIIEQTHAGQRHFSALLFPVDYDSAAHYPLLLWATGLNQASPVHSPQPSQSFIGRFFQGFPDHFIAIPAFRGQALVINSKRYCSDGFFGDAFAGATEDALRLLHLVRHEFPVDEERMGVFGISRGGTVALLMAAHYPDLKCAVAATGPVDFVNRQPYERYGLQFRYQFLGERKSMFDLRQRMILSSPVYFGQQIQPDLLMLYGQQDNVVPYWNAEKMLASMGEKENVSLITVAAGHSFDERERIKEWLAEHL
ncbi:MAG: prolyl oligopeptidase family serine peptidase [Bacteroidota bacterium]